MPSPEQERLGAKFLDPSREQDYGVHLFEEPTFHKIVAATAAGKFHLRYTALNCDFLIKKRRNRARAHRLETHPVGLLDLLPGQRRADLQFLINEAEVSVLPIPDLPPDTPIS